jgi:hypothetical protein
MQATSKQRDLFLTKVNKHFQNQNINECLHQLSNIPVQQWSHKNTIEFEKCNKQMIIGMLHAGNVRKKQKLISWSRTFANTVSKKSFLENSNAVKDDTQTTIIRIYKSGCKAWGSTTSSRWISQASRKTCRMLRKTLKKLKSKQKPCERNIYEIYKLRQN